MTDTPLSKIEELFRQKRWDEAAKMLRLYLVSVPITHQEQGASYTAIASAYLQAMNEIQKEYNQVLEGTISLLNDLQTIGVQAKDDIDLSRVNREIDALTNNNKF